MRIIADEDGILMRLADFDDLLERGLIAIERVDALDEDHRVLSLAVGEHAVERASAIMIEEAHLGLTEWRTGGHEGPVEDAGVAKIIEDERRIAIGERHDGPDHRLVAGRKDEAGFEAEIRREPLLKGHMLNRRRLDARRAQAAGIALNSLLRGLDHLRMCREPEIVIRAE